MGMKMKSLKFAILVVLASILLSRSAAKSFNGQLVPESSTRNLQSFSSLINTFNAGNATKQGACCAARILDYAISPAGAEQGYNAQGSAGAEPPCCDTRIFELLEEERRISEPDAEGQVAFGAAGLTDTRDGNLESDEWAVIPFKKETASVGQSFNLRTGIFEAPVTGVYHFEIHASSGSRKPHWIAIANATDMTIMAQGGKAGFEESVGRMSTHLSANMYLEAGQEILAVYKGTVSSKPSAQNRDPLGLSGAQFSGFLVFPY